MFGRKKEPKVEQKEELKKIETVQQNHEDNQKLLKAPDPEACKKVIDELLNENKPKGAILKLYLENFKMINDMFGYEYGQILLNRIFEFLNEMEYVQVLRYGGVEFLLILDGCGYSDAMGAAEEICGRFELPWHIDNMDYMCSVAVGVVFYPDKAENAAQAIKALDYATNRAEQSGQNRSAVYDGALQRKIARRYSIANQLKKFTSSPDMIQIRYRPTFHVGDGKFVRADSYMKLLSPEYGQIESAEFIPIAEDTGMICVLNHHTINTVCTEIRKLLDKGIEFESVAVPVSPIQLLQESFVGDIKKMIKLNKIPAGKLALEVSESVFISAFSQVNIVMQELSAMGVEMVLNEFGTGYSGINNILDLPVNVLKLERMFVWQMETNTKSRYVIQGLIQIARNLDLKLIAEGVETENQIQLLNEYGCQYEQGFYYSPTVESDVLEQIMGKEFHKSEDEK